MKRWLITILTGLMYVLCWPGLSYSPPPGHWQEGGGRHGEMTFRAMAAIALQDGERAIAGLFLYPLHQHHVNVYKGCDRPQY